MGTVIIEIYKERIFVMDGIAIVFFGLILYLGFIAIPETIDRVQAHSH